MTGFKDFKPGGLATGIGSLPHTSPSEGVEAVFASLPECPFWPQFPRLGVMEGMTNQYAEHFPGLRGTPDSPWVDTGEEGQAELAPFYEKIFSGDPSCFALSDKVSKGWPEFMAALARGVGAGAKCLKGHVTGPVTLSSALRDPNGREVAYAPDFRDAVAALLAANARWQIRELKKFNGRVIIFLDEPVMEVYGSAYSALDEETVYALWTPVLEAIRDEGALSGIHCCGNTDWPVLLKSGVDIVNFDAYQFLDRLTLFPKEVKAFLENGGMLAWGIVPTDGRADRESAEGLWTRLSEGMERFQKAGIDGALLRERCILTPSCGMGSLDVPLSMKILALLSALSERAGKEWR